MFQYEIKNSFENRKLEYKRLCYKYPNRVPVIIKKAENSKNTPDIDKEKYLVPGDLDIAQFLYIVRKRIKLAPDQAIFLFCNNESIPMSRKFSTLHREMASADGFLYVVFSLENTFGFV